MKYDVLRNRFDHTADASIFSSDCLDMLKSLPQNSVQLIVTSPPYNIGKEYEKKTGLDQYVAFQRDVIAECWRVLRPEGSICWQVGNHVDNGCVMPLDVLLFPVFLEQNFIPRNRIIWHFEHGLHCTNRFSGRHESISWFTKSNDYYFNLDPVRVPQKYPGKKHFKGPKAGQYSCNPKGKNPGDVWVFPNVKNNHVEKTAHPCQFPIELVERLILSMTQPGDWVLDPFVGSGTTIVAALLNYRKGIGAEIIPNYVDIILQRISELENGKLKYRSRDTAVYHPSAAGKNLTSAPWLIMEDQESSQVRQRALKQEAIFEEAARPYK